MIRCLSNMVRTRDSGVIARRIIVSLFLFSVLFSTDGLIGKVGQKAKGERGGNCGFHLCTGWLVGDESQCTGIIR